VPLPADPPAGLAAVDAETPPGDAVVGPPAVGTDALPAGVETGLDAVGAGNVGVTTGSGACSRCSPTSPLRRRSPIFSSTPSKAFTCKSKGPSRALRTTTSSALVASTTAAAASSKETCLLNTKFSFNTG